MPKISVILPTYNSERYIKECLDSILSQSFHDFEVLIINEYGSTDKTLEIIRSFHDDRIRIIQNETKLGLAESLNKGFRLALGEYLARMDSDDISYPTRLEKQVDFLDNNPKVGVCGSFQHHLGNNIDFIHAPPIEHEDIKASLLFRCDVCHSTVILRKKIILEQNLFYDNQYYAEDYELWLRAINYTEFHTIPEVLGMYRVSGDSITDQKKEKLNTESGELVLRILKENLNLLLAKEDAVYFQGWENPYLDSSLRLKHSCFKEKLIAIYDANQKNHYYSEDSLLYSFALKWNWSKSDYKQVKKDESRTISTVLKFHLIDDTLLRVKCYLKQHKVLYSFFKIFKQKLFLYKGRF